MCFLFPTKIEYSAKKDGSSGRKTKGRLIILFLAGFVILSSVLWVIWASVRMPSVSFCEGVGEYSLNASTEVEREDFFRQFGYEVSYLTSCDIVVPSQGSVLCEYNEIQKKQGLNILPYGDKKVQMYIFKLSRDNSAILYGFMIVYRDKVIGAHISDCLYPARIMSLLE